LLLLPEHSRPDRLDDLLERRRDVVFGTIRHHLVLQPLDLLHPRSEDEDVLCSHLLEDLDVGSVHRADDESAVHHELHVACPRRLSARSGDVLTQLGRRDDDFCVGDVVVGKEYHLEQTFGLAVVVHN